MSVTLILILIAVLLIVAGPLRAVGGTGSLTNPRDDLMEALEEYNIDKGAYIAEKVFPLSDAKHKKATHSRIPREALTSLERDLRRGTDGSYPQMQFGVEDSSYECIEYGPEVPLDDAQVQQLSDSYGIPVDQVAADLAWSQVMRHYEKRVADQVMDPVTNFTAGQGNYTDVSGSNPWATAASDHIKTVHDAKLAATVLIGEEPDSLAMSEKQWLNLIHSTQFAGRLQYVREATFQAIADFIAPALGVRNIFVGKLAYNTTAEGGTFSGTRVWSDTYVNLFKVGKLGVTKIWKADAAKLVVMEEYYSDARRGRVMRARQVVDELVLDVLAGHLLKVA